MVDIATLGIAIDSTPIAEAVTKLDDLSSAGSKAENVIKDLTAANENLASATNVGASATATAAREAENLLGKQTSTNGALGLASVAARKAAVDVETLGGNFKLLANDVAGGGSALTALGRIAPTTLGALGPLLLPVLAILAAITAAVLAVVAVFAIGSLAISKSVGDVTKGMGLTEKQLDSLKKKGTDISVTMADTFKGLAKTLGDTFKPQIDAVKKYFGDMFDSVSKWTYNAIRNLVGGFVGAFAAIKVAWSILPAVFSDIAVRAANGVIAIIESMVNKVVGKINVIASLANSASEKVGLGSVFGKVGQFNAGRIANPNAGAAAGASAAIGGAYNSGFSRGAGAVDNFASSVAANARAAAEERIRGDAGDPGKAKKAKGGKGAANDNEDSATKAATDYIANLKQETAEIGKNAIEIKKMEAERAAAVAPTVALKNAIMASYEAWKTATQQQATDEFVKGLKEANDNIAFQTSLVGKNAKEVEVLNAQREVSIMLAKAEKDGVDITSAAVKEQTDAILANAEARGQLQLNVDNAHEYADGINRVGEALRNASADFGELFGTAGEGFSQLIDEITNYASTQADLMAQMTEDEQKYGEASSQVAEDRARMAQEQVNHYGNLISAGKNFFAKNSAGYKILEAAERAYRVYQLVSAAIEFATKAKSIATDVAHTASSVANSGVRATAHGIEAIAKAIASLPFPLNLIAGAATAAALIAVGVKVFGGGGGGGGAVAAADSSDAKLATSDSMTSPYSTLPGAGGLYDPKNAGKSANDNRYAANSNTYGSSNGLTVAPIYNINAPGADAGTVQQIQQVLDNHQAQTVQMAREASASDRYDAETRQRIGSGG